MTQQDKEMLEQNGFDVSGALRRFINNEALYLQCLGKFLSDTSYDKLKKALEEGDCKTAFHEAHTMKGFVSNLGMVELYETVSVIVEMLRADNMEVSEQMQTLDKVYEKDYNIIDEIIKNCPH